MNGVVVAVALAWGLAVAVPLGSRARRARGRTRAWGLVAGRAGRGRGLRRRGGGARRGWTGLVGPAVAGVGLRSARRARARAVERALPLTLDLLTVAARAGLTPRLALGVAATWCPVEARAPLAAAEERCRLGATFADALAGVAASEPTLAPLADALAVAERSGAPTADLLARLATEARADLRRRAEAHARRVPVRLLFPLVFLVLPAFGLLTVAPALLAGLRTT